jgi:hypothetical protein
MGCISSRVGILKITQDADLTECRIPFKVNGDKS